MTAIDLTQHIEDAARSRSPVVFVNADRTVLVTVHPNGTVSVALRDDAGHIWGPPINVERES